MADEADPHYARRDVGRDADLMAGFGARGQLVAKDTWPH